MRLIHKDFRINGCRFSNAEELLQFSSTISTSLFNFCKDWFSVDDFVIVKTSGSTGKPKNISLQKKHMVNSAIATATFFNLKEQTTALCCLPTEFIAGKMMMVRAMVLGWHMDIVEPTSNPLKNIEKMYDFSAMVPLQLRNSLDKIDTIKQLIVGGGVVSVDLIEMIQEVSTQIYATYGMTETITHVAVKSLNLSSRGSITKRSHYQILSNISISADHRSCLVINAPKVSDETIVTNDVVEMISETEFEWKGRYDNVINSGGIKLHPEEIERKLSPHIKQRFFLIGIPDKQLGERLVLIVEGEREAVRVDFHQILNKYEIPKALFFIDQFVETPTQKVQRSATLAKLQTN